jgi:hypothetical protein
MGEKARGEIRRRIDSHTVPHVVKTEDRECI